MYTQIHINKYIEHQGKNNKHEEDMHENEQMYKNVALNFSRRHEEEPSISETFVRLNMLDYESAE